MAPIYDALGVTVSAIQEGDDPAFRRTKYACDVTYGTNSEFGFDYLRDNMAGSLEECVQRGYDFAIVDEVDNILIDEARTPLIISGRPEQAADLYYTFARLAKTMVGEEHKTKLKSLGESKDTTEAEYDYEYDEKHKTVAPTERGVKKAEEFLGVDNLYLGEHGTLVNHLIQALKAESLYKRDTEYAVVDGQVMIIDEFTGRILEGRRWSEGLHQAIEAKEGVSIREENQTLATITLQNYFRLYDKLSGMTGTALTEATEFMKIYKVPTVEIPTNVPMVRADQNDAIYKTKQGKWNAVVNEVESRSNAGQPVLVGTISVETSEMLSGELKRRGIEHVILNAKPEHAEREGETIAQAGRRGAVTIATNMAGRGVDIKLGGNPEQMARHELANRGIKPGADNYEDALKELTAELETQTSAEAEQVREAGGLYILGTERHESRRIDNQLRGRSGRQGDPGESRFFLSAEDDLIRLFAGERIYKILDRLGPVDEEGNEEALEAKMLTKTIEGAQKKVEQQNFLIRKRVLEYDDVMNEQRRVIYRYRREVLEGKDMSDDAREQLVMVVSRMVDTYTPGRRARGVGPGRAADPGPAALAVRGRPLGPLARDHRPREPAREPGRRRAGRLRPPRGGVRRRGHAPARARDPAAADRQPLARAPGRDGLPARGHPPARLRPDRPPGRLQERGLLDVRGADVLDLGGVRPHDLPRPGRGRPPGPAGAGARAAPGQRQLLRRHARVPAQRDGGDRSGGGRPGRRRRGAAAPRRRPGRPRHHPRRHPRPPRAATASATNPQTVVKDEQEKIGRNDPCWCGSGKKYKKCHGA